MSLPKIVVPVIVFLVVTTIIGALLSHPRKSAKPTSTPAANTTASIRYLPLGDSYTIGESVSQVDRWPDQLVARLKTTGASIVILDNPAVTGYTTQDLIDNELPLIAQLKPNFVTVQIGVNDYFQGLGVNEFQKNLTYIIQFLQAKLPAPSKILLVTIPDYGLTPTGAASGNPMSIEAGVRQFNASIVSIAQHYNVPVADIFPASQQVATDASLIADDGLHPSAKQYTNWVAVIYPVAQQILEVK